MNDQETKLNERAKSPMKNIWLDCDPVIIIQMNREPNKQYIIGPRRRDSHPARRVRIQRKFTGNIDCECIVRPSFIYGFLSKCDRFTEIAMRNVLSTTLFVACTHLVPAQTF